MIAFRKRCLKKWISFLLILIFVTICVFYIIHLLVNGIALNNVHIISCDKEINKEHGNRLTSGHQHLQVWIKTKKKKTKHLNHVVNAFKAFNSEIFQLGEGEKPDSEWNVLWSHDYPFKELKRHFLSVKIPHCINHFPGTGFITNKVTLASSGIHSIPRAFRIPKEKSDFLKYAGKNPNTMFIQKSSNHRGIKIERVDHLDFTKNASFVQQFIHNPLLVDGYKFDIGVYTVITSVDPLRVYIHKEVLFRYCSEKYHPFAANDSRKYVVGDSYRPTWEVPSLKQYYKEQGLGMKTSFNSWLKSQKKNPTVVWEKVENSIRNVFYTNEHNIIAHSKTYHSHLKFFELMRFDFIIDEDLNVYLMEANMSPNLSSAHFSENRLMYEQVVFNLLSLVGLSYGRCTQSPSPEEKEMRASRRDITVFPEHCAMHCRDSSDCGEVHCQLCYICLTDYNAQTLRTALLEHTWRGSYRRVIPEPIKPEDADIPSRSENLSPKNTLMAEWFRGKCLLDITFCS